MSLADRSKAQIIAAYRLLETENTMLTLRIRALEAEDAQRKAASTTAKACSKKGNL